MNATARLAGFGFALAGVLGAGAVLGAVVGPDVTRAEEEAPAPIGEGVVGAEEGYRFVPSGPALDAGGGTFRFTITDQEGERVRDFTPIHERDLHLVVVSRELTTFHHVHPTLDVDGTWSVELPALAAGSYRAVADFQVADGPRLALGTDLAVAGTYEPVELGEPQATSTVDGYEVTLETERGKGGEVTAALTVRRDGEIVTDLEPYLGANGHLVAMRAGDLAYAHVHPIDDGDDDDGEAASGAVRFDADLPSAGRYGLFFDFQHDGIVRTASFT
ncbi:MAG: hypothetical protein ACRDZZ_05715, partial [Ilumatobacteraceae bacterium]